MACWKRRLKSSALSVGQLFVQLRHCSTHGSPKPSLLFTLLLLPFLLQRTLHLMGSLWLARRNASRASPQKRRRFQTSRGRALQRQPSTRASLYRNPFGFRPVSGNGLIGENLDPHLTATLDVTGHGDTGRLNLAGSDPGGLQSLQAKIAVGHLVAARGLTGQAASVNPAVFSLSWAAALVWPPSRRGFAHRREPRHGRSIPLRRSGRRWCSPQQSRNRCPARRVCSGMVPS